METKLNDKLQKLIAANKFRTLSTGNDLIDFASNDYLGLANSARFGDLLHQNLNEYPTLSGGSTGSRLITGNSELHEKTEQEIADFHKAQSGLLFNSGYDANLGLLSTLPGKNDTIIYDQLVHASIRDGMRLSLAKSWPFEHNSPESLKNKLQKASGEVYVVVESVYSMDGDIAPLEALATLCREKGAHLIVDEAHATGVIGEQGKGLVNQLGLEAQVLARIHTFGKALGCHGAIVLGSQTLKDFLVNFCRSFIYTTALPPHSVMAILTAYELFPGMDQERAHLTQLSATLEGTNHATDLSSPIHCEVIPGNEHVKAKAREVQKQGYDVRPILHPTVPKGAERIRICLHAFNTVDQVEDLKQLLHTNNQTSQ